MAYVGTLAINVVANTGRFRTGLRTASRDVTMFTGTINKSMRVLTPFSSMFGAGLAFGAAYGLIRMGKAANEFAGEMNRSLAIMSDVGPKMRAEMERTAHAVAATTQFSAREAASAYFFLASAGMDAKASLAALPAVSRFAQAANFDLATASDLATDAQSAMGLKSKDAAINLKLLTRVTDALVKANTLANASIVQFSESITNKAGVAARMYGIEIEETLAVLAAFADQGIKGAEAGTKFHIVLRDLTTKAIRNKEAFEELGVAVFKFGEVRKLADIIEDLEKRFASLGDEMRKTTLLQLGFTDKSVSGLQALIGYSAQIREWEEDIKAAGGATKDVSENVLTKFDEAWNRIAASLGTVASDIFPPILGGLADMADLATGAGDALGGIEDAIPDPERFSAKVGEFIKTYIWAAKKFAALPELAIGKLLYEGSKVIAPEDTNPFYGERERESFEKYRAAHDQQWAEIEERYARVGQVELVGFTPKLYEPQPIGRRRREGALAGADRMAMFQSDYSKARVEAWKEEGKERQKWFDAEEKRWQKYDLILAQRDEAEILKKHAKAQKAWNDKLTDAAHLYDLTRTPMERFKDRLADIESLLSSGALKDPNVAARRFGQLAKELGEEKAAPSPGPETFAPAMLRGSVEAYEVMIRSISPNRLRDPEEDTAKAAMEIAKNFPKLMQTLLLMKNNQVKPGTVEVAP